MIEVPAILVLFAIIMVPCAAASIIGNYWVATKAVEMLERRYAICQDCATCLLREAQSR